MITKLITIVLLLASFVLIQNSCAEDKSPFPTLEEIKAVGLLNSTYKNQQVKPTISGTPEPDLATFHAEIKPILEEACFKCHGEKKQKGDFRVDDLDPDLTNGQDVDWWLEVVDVLSNGEMPPEKEEDMSDDDISKVIDWLSSEVQLASQIRRSEGGHSSFRRMTRYEFNYALQDLLGLPQNLAQDLPPETVSEDGFQNSSEMLQMTSQQLTIYRDIAREALQSATFKEQRPEPLYFSITMDKGGKPYENWINKMIVELKQKKLDNPEVGFEGPWKFNRAKRSMEKKGFSPYKTHYLNRDTNEGWERRIPYGYSPWEPTKQKPVDPEVQPFAVVIPHGAKHKIDLGNSLPDRGTVKIRFRASRATTEDNSYPSLRLSFGNKSGQNSEIDFVISEEDIAITALPDKPEFYEWLIPMDALHRNPFLRTKLLGMNPNASEHIFISNVHQGLKHENASVHIDYIEITAPFITEWPPQSHRDIFLDTAKSENEIDNAHKIIENFIQKAWRRPVSEKELQRRIALFQKIRPVIGNFQDAIIEVLATVISSPNFIYLAQSNDNITDHELATRLSFFLWGSQPDETLLNIVSNGSIRHSGTLAEQAERMLADPRAKRFAQNFTHQWLDMDLLELLKVNKESYPNFSHELKESMQKEPVAFFQYLLDNNRSIIDFLHTDYVLVNQNLAKHYGLNNVFGNHFQKVDLPSETKRGGLLAQAGLLAMNSDGKNSHPLKRGIWILESLLHDPPPPPPAVVPQIDLADPEILKMTLKERIEDHRNDPACMSCHTKIDPWGIALEEFDATGAWRNQVDGKPVDATSLLYNQSELKGMDGLKRYLLENRQDQFTRAIVHKLASYALGRPLSFNDWAEIELITTKLRQKDDGLRTLIKLLVESKLFQNT